MSAAAISMSNWQETHLPPADDQPATQYASNLNNSKAVEKIPVEIWHRILGFAISCTLLPGEDDDYYHGQAIRDLDCIMVADYKRSEIIRTKLRLVCRQWDQFLDNFSDRLVQLTPDAPMGYWPPVKRWDRVIRIQGPHNIFCTCKHSCWPPFDRKGDALSKGNLLRPVPPRLQSQIRETVLPQLSNQCKAILWPGVWQDDFVDPERFDSVIMFAHAFRDSEHATKQAAIISSTYMRLTHLEFWMPSLCNPSFYLSLERLETLRIYTEKTDGDLEPKVASDTHSVGKWHLPSLRSLSVWIVAWTENDVRAFNMLLHQIGKGLTGLYMCDLTEDSVTGHPVISENTWSWLPSLEVVGTNLKHISLMPAPRKGTRSPITLLIDGETNLINHIPPRQVLEDIRKNWSLSATGEVIVNEPWSEMIRAIEDDEAWLGQGLHDSEIDVLDVLHAIGTGLRDSEGVPFQERIRRQLHVALTNQKRRAAEEKLSASP
ncbi:hypothetical protein M408DRAFT_26894 [Serendipita vermifera MAFF 305830]|uniref:Uncharacterized protein n=1 Tax=Serendipita vermifera MAFF 305830 TaxID=933852 RepID=A0A0C3AJ31_SERVB|nr:hypothetical protein M408DRAFT_26894 [Serendipita vermifera MAFF 305830]